MKTVYRVKIYPWSDSSDSADWYFDTREEAQKFASYINDNAADPEYLAGGHGNKVEVTQVDTIDLDEAIDELRMWVVEFDEDDFDADHPDPEKIIPAEPEDT